MDLRLRYLAQVTYVLPLGALALAQLYYIAQSVAVLQVVGLL